MSLNIGFIHDSCADERKEKFQKNNPNLDLKGASHVQLAFREGNLVEWMWVLITEYDNVTKLGKGTLSNDPVKLDNFRFGDIIDFEYHHISNVIWH